MLLVAHAYSNAHMGGRPPSGLNRGASLPLSERPLLRMSGKPLLQVSGRPLLHMSGKPLLQVARVFLCDNFHRPFVHNTPRQIHSVHAPAANKQSEADSMPSLRRCKNNAEGRFLTPKIRQHNKQIALTSPGASGHNARRSPYNIRVWRSQPPRTKAGRNADLLERSDDDEQLIALLAARLDDAAAQQIVPEHNVVNT